MIWQAMVLAPVAATNQGKGPPQLSPSQLSQTEMCIGRYHSTAFSGACASKLGLFMLQEGMCMLD